VDALGDGLDVNGAISMSGGRVIVIGPTGNMNGALALLDSLTFGEALPPEMEASRVAWRATQDRVEQWYAEVAARRAPADEADSEG
jgi:hypothetical protein